MEKNIVYQLLYSCDDLDKQRFIINEIKPFVDSLDNTTKEIISIVEQNNAINKVTDIKTLNTYISFNKTDIDIDDYFWELDSDSVERYDIDSLVNTFVLNKTKELNTKLIETAYDKYEKDGDITHLQSIEYISSSKENVFIDISNAVDMGLEHLRKIKDKEDIGAINFSSQFFNTQIITKGFMPGEFVIMAARPGVGKTAFGLSFANDISKHGKKVLFVSLEMNINEIMERILIAKTSITRHTIMSASKFTDDKFNIFKEEAEKLKEQPLVFIDNPPSSFMEIKDVIKKQHKQNKFDIIFIDYLSLISSYDRFENADLRTTTSKISRGLKLLAMELNIPIVALQQVSRAVSVGNRKDASYGELQLTDLRESGSLEQDANKVFLLWNQEPKDEKEEKDWLNKGKQNVILYIAKNRNGQSGHKVLFDFNKNLQRVKEISWLTAPDGFGALE